MLDTLKHGGAQRSVECIQRIHIALDYMETLSQDVRLSLMTKDTDPSDIGGLREAVYLYVDDLMCQGEWMGCQPPRVDCEHAGSSAYHSLGRVDH